jgi:hypothetical protein
MGVEPTSGPWQGPILPMYDSRVILTCANDRHGEIRGALDVSASRATLWAAAPLEYVRRRYSANPIAPCGD